MNAASANPTTRFNALLVEGDKALGLDATLRDEGCAVQRVTSRAAALEAIADVDLVVIGASDLSEDDVIAIIDAAQDASILVVNAPADLAVRATMKGAQVLVAGMPAELAVAQLKQVIGIADLKSRASTSVSMPSTFSASPTSGVVQRRSAPLPKEATPDALQLLIESAENLVPMHKFQRVYVDYALRRFGGNKVHTAAALGIDRRTIQRWARARTEQRPAQATTNTNTTTSSS